MTTGVNTEAVVAESDNPTTETAGVDQELVGRLVAQAREQGLELTGEGGLPAELPKRVLESALEGEMTDIWAVTATNGRAMVVGMPVTGTGPRPSPPRSARSRPTCRGTGTPRSSRRSCASGSGG